MDCELQQLAGELGVSADSLTGVGFKRVGNEWHNPEHDAEGNVTGTARRLDNGKKSFIAGGQRGLTMQVPLGDYDGSSINEPILVVEGATDTAAGLDLDFVTVGRPSATGGLDHLKILMENRHAVIVGENDDNDAGKNGAEKIAAGLVSVTESVRVVFPPEGVKDLRRWRMAGCTRADLMAAIKAVEPFEPEAVDAGVIAIDPFQPFPVGALPEPLRGFINTTAGSIGCDKSYVALPLLATTASAIGNSRRIQLKPGWTEPCVVWTAAIGESGSMKTPAFRACLKPLRDVQRRELEEYDKKVIEFEIENAKYEKSHQEWKKNKEPTDPPEKPREPTPVRMIVSDATFEAIAVILKDNWRGLLLARDELSGWIASFDGYKASTGADAAHWLSIFNAEPLVVDRKTGPTKTITVENTSCCVTGGIQPGPLERVLGAEHRENGLLARLLLSYPPQRQKRWTDAGIPPEEEAKIATLFDRLRELRANDIEGREDPVVVQLTPAGRAAFIAFYNSHAQEQAGLTGDLAAAWSKLECYAARLALVVHFTRWAAADPTLTDPDYVDEISVAAGVELVTWFGLEARRVYAALGEDEGDRDTRRLVELIRRRGGSLKPRDLMRASRAYKTAKDAEDALDQLQVAGLGRWVVHPSSPGGGRPSKRLLLVDSADSDKTPIDGIAARGFVNVSSVNRVLTEPGREVVRI